MNPSVPLQLATLEFQLICASARTQLSSSEQHALTSLMAQGMDWEKVLALCQRHKVTALVYQSLKNLEASAIPPEWLKQLRERVKLQTQQNLVLAATLVEIVQLFQVHHIPLLPFKGPSLAASVYGNLSLRQSLDLDILIQPKYADAAMALLVAHGYQWVFPDIPLNPKQHALFRWVHPDCALRHPQNSVKVELHWRFSRNIFVKPVSATEVETPGDTVKLGGTELPILSPEALLSYLCFHGSKHRWERLFWVCDVAELINRHETWDWEALIRENEAQYNGRCLALGLVVAQQLFEISLPNYVSAWAGQQLEPTGLLDQVYQEMAGEQIRVERTSELQSFYKQVAENRYNARLLESIPAKIFEVARLVFFPNLKEFEWIRLPEALTPLYFLVRPVYVVWRFVISPVLKRFSGGKR